MPLIVQCPRGCQVRMSRNRAGKIVRCPECKCAMRVPKLTEKQLSMGDVIPCRAKIAHRLRLDPAETERRRLESEKAEKERVELERVELERAKEKAIAKQMPEEQSALSEAARTRSVGEPDQVEGHDANDRRLPVPKLKPKSPSPVLSDPIDPLSAKTKSTLVNESLNQSVESQVGDPATEVISQLVESQTEQVIIQPTAALVNIHDGEANRPGVILAEPPRLKIPDPVLQLRSVEIQVSPASSQPTVISLTDPIPVEEERNWEERLTRANTDRKMLARFFALCLCLVALVNMVPAIYHWYHWTQLTDSAPLPRWIYIQIFIGAIHLIYAVFLAQIPDWSAMRAVSVALLLMAFVFGIVSTGLLVGGQGNLSGFLGIPFALNRQACIWCVAMLCLATLMSYWGGKESANWQRAEHLLKGILAKSPA